MNLAWVLTLGALLFSVGVYGVLARRNAVLVLMSIELMLNAVNINLVAFSRYSASDAVRGQIFALFVLTVAAAEAAVGLAIILLISRKRDAIDLPKIDLMKG